MVTNVARMSYDVDRLVDLYKVFRDQDSKIVDHLRQSFQIWVTLILAVLGASLAGLQQFRQDSEVLVIVMVGPAANLLLCILGRDWYRRAVTRYFENIHILAKLEKNIHLGQENIDEPSEELLLENNLPESWLARKGNIGDAAAFVEDRMKASHVWLVNVCFVLLFIINLMAGVAIISLVNWSGLSQRLEFAFSNPVSSITYAWVIISVIVFIVGFFFVGRRKQALGE